MKRPPRVLEQQAWERYLARLSSKGKQNTAEFAAVITKARASHFENDTSIRAHLEYLLDALEGAQLNEIEQLKTKRARHRLPVDNKQKDQPTQFGYLKAPAPDYRWNAEEGFLHSIRELRCKLREGGDVYRIAWLAIEVGASATLGDAVRGRLTVMGGTTGVEKKNRDAGIDERNAKICRYVAEILAGVDPELKNRLSTDPVEMFRREKAARQQKKNGTATPNKRLKKGAAYERAAKKFGLGAKQVARIHLKEEEKTQQLLAK